MQTGTVSVYPTNYGIRIEEHGIIFPNPDSEAGRTSRKILKLSRQFEDYNPRYNKGRKRRTHRDFN